MLVLVFYISHYCGRFWQKVLKDVCVYWQIGELTDMMVMSVMSNTMVTFDMMVMSDMNGHDSHDTESQDGNVCHDGHVWHDGHDHYDHPRHHHCSFPPWDLLNLPG